MIHTAFAAITTLCELSTTIKENILSPVFSILLSVAAIVFVWGVIQFIRNAASDTEREKGKKHIVWGLIGLAVIFGVWGLVRLILETFAIDPSGIGTCLPS